MLKVKLIVLGNLKEQYWKDAELEYVKRLSRYAQLETSEIKEQRIKDKPSESEIKQALEKEAEFILKKIAADDYVVCLAINGKMLSSEELATQINDYEMLGKNVVFIIGSSHGLAEAIYQRANAQISFSKMTFPHQMMRIIFLEQLYRAYKINNNEQYHK